MFSRMRDTHFVEQAQPKRTRRGFHADVNISRTRRRSQQLTEKRSWGNKAVGVGSFPNDMTHFPLVHHAQAHAYIKRVIVALVKQTPVLNSTLEVLTVRIKQFEQGRVDFLHPTYSLPFFKEQIEHESQASRNFEIPHHIGAAVSCSYAVTPALTASHNHGDWI